MVFYSKPRVYEHTSRYGKYRQIVEEGVSRVETFNQTFVDKSENDKFHIVATEQENRLDIIAYKLNNGTMVTHRVVNVTENGLETKGDNNKVLDGVITTKKNYVGKNI